MVDLLLTVIVLVIGGLFVLAGVAPLLFLLSLPFARWIYRSDDKLLNELMAQLPSKEQRYGPNDPIEQKRIQALRVYSKGTYDDFLRTPYWREVVRPMVLDRARMTCEGCGATHVPLEVHHTDYLVVGYEVYHLDSLRAFCRGCHYATHQRQRTP